MSEGDVSLIRDEDVLRRMWQQTEDFSKKKEIRAHMYRLREERLRNLYSPEPNQRGKGVESAMHVSSLADQSFQGLKSKEVRDAGSPPKDYCRPGPDLKELSNAGWNVESENRTTDDGHTQIRSVRADIEGRYDVEGGRGQFAAADSHRQARTEYRDDNTSLQRSEARSDTAQREHVVKNTDDGTQVSSTTSSSTSSSKFQQVSSSTHQVPYIQDKDDVTRKESSLRRERVTDESGRDTSATREHITKHVTNTSDYERNLKSTNYESGELVSRKVDYPDANTKVIVETRCLPDGTRVTSTRKEFRTPVQTTRSEQQSSRSESRSYSTQQRSDNQSNKITREYDIVDSQRHADDYDFKKKLVQYTNEDDSKIQRTEQKNTENTTFKKETSSKITRESVDRRNDTTDSETLVENYSNVKDDYKTQNKKQHCESRASESNQHTDYSTVKRTHHYDSKTDAADHRKTVSSFDNQNIQRDVKESQDVKSDRERVHEVKRDQKVKEVVDKKISDQYETTYQSDYSQKKISNDWSPTHQAWASTLRADTPTSTRPTARASSPGSNTHQSSTSSLRSSVSPDKNSRKPCSRGSSPNKMDRSSPSRHSSDRYSSTHSTHSVTETKVYKQSSPDRKPPQSPTRHRPSQSPEKRPSSSPERKPGYKSVSTEEFPRTKSPARHPDGTPRPSPSPERRPYQPPGRATPDTNLPTSPRRSISPEKKVYERPKDVPFTRPNLSPDRKPGYQRPSTSPSDDYPRPEYKDYQQPSPTRSSPEKPTGKSKDISPTRPSVSPDRKPGYMRPTSASKPSDTPKYTSPDRRSVKHISSQSPERKPHKTTTIKEDHYKFIDEETKMYTRRDRENIEYKRMSPSPDRYSGNPGDVTDYCRSESPSLRPTLRKGSRSPSPPKGPVTFTEDQVDKTEKTTDVINSYDEQVHKTSRPGKQADSPLKEKPRESSPSKYGTYDKKRRTEEFEEVTLTTSKDTEDIKYDSLTSHQKIFTESDIPSPLKSQRDSDSPMKPVFDTPRKPSPPKFGTYDKKHRTEETEEITTTTKSTDKKYDTFTRQKSPSKVPDSPSTTKKSPRGSTSPVKSPTKDVKYKHTTDFIATEKMTEEVSKKTKDRSRQLVTPSTSPTRKPKVDDTAPSTGQSSPTTSVSGFVYFSSPKTERTIVTDLDDEEFYSETINTEEIASTTTHKRPETLNVERSPSPSKIPCRSPSPEKKMSPKETLPRKSSLKKPSTGSNSVSPVEKPPSSFRISPDEETRDFPEHKVVKKDNPNKPIDDSPAKSKPPFERRETYEERCLKILGVVDDKTVTEETLQQKSVGRSPSVSPCRSPVSKEGSPFRSISSNIETTKIQVTDFLTREKEDIVKKSSTHRINDEKSKIPSRASSPTKLQDIISEKTFTNFNITSAEDIKEESIIKKVRESPDTDIGYHQTRLSMSPEKSSYKTSPRPSPSPERKSTRQTPTDSSSTNIRSKSPSKDSTPARRMSPEGKPEYQKPIKSSPNLDDKHPKEASPTRPSVSPERKPGYMRSTTATSNKHESTTVTDEVREDFTSTTIRKSIDKETGYQNPEPQPNQRPRESPERKPSHREPSPVKGDTKKKPDEKTSPKTSGSPDRPGYMRPTTATITKFEETTTIEDFRKESRSEDSVEILSTTKTNERPSSRSPSPAKKHEEPKHSRTPSPTKKITEYSTLLIQTEKEQEILDRVQQSLRKLSPTRDQRSTSREKSPGKNTISLQDIDVVTSSSKEISEDNIVQRETAMKSDIPRMMKPKDDKPKEQKPVSKPPSRTVSPTKKPTVSHPTKTSPETVNNKTRSISPKKPVSPVDRPQSPQIPKASGNKPREPTPSSLNRKSTPSYISPPKSTTIEVKKTAVIKQNSLTKMSTTKTTTTSKNSSSVTKSEPEPKRAPTPKGINKENVSPKKDDVKVTRTASDTSLKNKKPSPQRMKSKPEIQVNDLSPTRAIKITPKKSNETPSKLAPKPKSATALNTPQDDDDIIIDVELAKSSRENSPDRICPTPVGFLEDVGTPRYPDEVSEPDDDFRKRTHQTIHETESIVDDIVEISEDEELFVKRTDVDKVTGSDECLLSVTDKVTKFANKIETVTKPKETTNQFKDVEKRVHSDFVDENLKTDECLLSVFEKVNKFAKGPRDIKDKSPARNIVDEYDTQTTYQDDYTKLSVNDKAHLFVETAENSKVTKTKPVQKVERPDLTNVEDSLKSDDCLLSVSDKVNKFVKTAEQFLNETRESEEKEKAVREQYDKFIKNIVQNEHHDTTSTVTNTVETDVTQKESHTKVPADKTPSFAKETASSHTKVKDYASPNLKSTDRTPTVKITTLRSSEAVKKAKALFENIASTTQQTKDTKTTKLLDIGVIKKSPKTDSTIVLHPSVEEIAKEPESEVDAPYSHSPKDRPSSGTSTRSRYDDKPRSSPTRLTTQSPEVSRTKSPMRQTVETVTTTTKTVLSRYPAAQNEPVKHVRSETNKLDKPTEKSARRTPEPKQMRPEAEKPQDRVPSYQRATKTSQIKEEKTVEETEVSSRRGSGKFGVELRRTSAERGAAGPERGAAGPERRRSSDHHQPCIDDIFDLDLLEQMLEKVVGYEQRRRIRAQIRVARKKMESDQIDNTYTKTKHTTVTKTRSPERRPQAKSPERRPTQKTFSAEPHPTSTPHKPSLTEVAQPKEASKPVLNGHAKAPSSPPDRRQRPLSPEKPKFATKTKSPVRHLSPEKKTRSSPTKVAPKPKSNRFNEYASAYMKKVGLNETDKVKLFDKTKRVNDVENQREQTQTVTTEIDDRMSKQYEEHRKVETKTSMSKSTSERTSSRETIEVVHVNGHQAKRSPSPGKQRSPERPAHSPSDRLYQRSPSPDFKRKADVSKKETVIKTVYETQPTVTKKETIIKTVYEERPKVEGNKKETIIKTVYDIQPKQAIDAKPSWVTNRNLKKITSETRTFSNKKVDEKKARAGSPSKALVRPTDAITSSYGPGPLDADGRPLFGIKALRNGATNYQVKGTVIRQEFHSRNGGEPEGTVSVTAYSTEPEDLERLLQSQGERPSRIHGLAAITTTKKFGGETGTTLKEAHSRDERAALEQFTHSDRRLADNTMVQHTTDTHEGKRRTEEKRERVDRREDKKTVRQSSVKSLTEKYIKSASDTSKSERTSYPKAGLILRTTNLKDSVSSDSSQHAGLGRTDSAHSLGSVEDGAAVTRRPAPQPTLTTTTTSSSTTASSRREERSFLDSSTKVSGVQDILTRMKNADIVIEDGDSTEDTEARALLNKFLGASVLMAGMQAYVTERPQGQLSQRQESVRSSSGGGKSVSGSRVEELDLDQCWDEALLRKLLEESTDYEQRRRIRARIRALMAEQEACASAVTEALAAAGGALTDEAAESREEKEVTVTSSVRRNSSEKTVSSSTTTKTSKVIESVARPVPKQVSPFAKFRQLEKQNSLNSPNSPKTPQSPGSPAKAPYFKFTDPALQASALTIKERLLQWCRDKTRDYENVKLENFSTSWADGLAFCALLHHFLPDAFDYSQLTPERRRHNFTLAFKLADEKAGIYPLLDVDDMVAMRKPDWKCVFTYVQAIHRRFKDQP